MEKTETQTMVRIESANVLDQANFSTGETTMANKPVKKRNLHACHPIMRKGGVHQKSKGARRAEEKRQWRNHSRDISREDSYQPVRLLIF